MATKRKKRKKELSQGVKIALLSFGIVLLLMIIYGFSLLIARWEYPLEHREIVAAWSEEYDVPEEIIYAVIKTESDFVLNAESAAGAKGLMQIMPSTFAYIASKLDVAVSEEEIGLANRNIQFGTYYLSYLYLRFEDWNTALAAYNAGEGNVSDWLNNEAYTNENGELLPDKIPFPETRNYVEKVNAAILEYRPRCAER